MQNLFIFIHYIFNCKTLIVLCQGFWEGKPPGQNTGAATPTENLGRNVAKEAEGMDKGE